MIDGDIPWQVEQLLATGGDVILAKHHG
jgi:hypothetical protein